MRAAVYDRGCGGTRLAKSAENGKISLRGIIFDYGNVLCHAQQPSDVEQMAAVLGISTGQLRELYWKFRFSYDRSDLDGKTYWAAVARECGITVGDEQISQLFALDTASWGRENEPVVRWAGQLHDAGYSLGLLSNMPLELSRALSASGSWAQHIRRRTFSCDVRKNKPDPMIYETCLRSLELAAHDVLFLDDIAINVEAARRLGIHAVIFDTLERTWARISEQFDLPVPLDLVSSETV